MSNTLEPLTEEERKLLKGKSLIWAIILDGRSIYDTSYDKRRMEAGMKYLAAILPAKTMKRYRLRLLTFRFANQVLTAAKEAEDARFNAWMEERRAER